mgnify:CR=1 FL=1
MLSVAAQHVPPPQRRQQLHDRFPHRRVAVEAVVAAPRDDQRLIGAEDLLLTQPRVGQRVRLLGEADEGSDPDDESSGSESSADIVADQENSADPFSESAPVMLVGGEEEDEEPLYLGFFHTGAYQDAISGYGGIKHCLIPSPKHVIIDRDEKGNIIDYVYRNEQSAQDMFKILGYKKNNLK